MANSYISRPYRIHDLTGQRFGHRLVIAFLHINHQAFWRVKCDCGNEKIVSGGNLRSGRSQSCGCVRDEATRIRNHKTSWRHGYAGKDRPPEYQIWLNILQRCYNPKNKSFKNYGARGIRAKPWRRSFQTFITEMGFRPPGKTKNGHALYSIDRIDNNRGYSKENCRWATASEQLRNRRKS